MTQYIAYYRVSTEKQGARGLGMQSQTHILAHYLGDDIIAAYREVGSAGEGKERPALAAAIEHCQKTGATLAVAKVDRLSRHTETVLEIYELLNRRLFCADLPNVDKFTLTLFAAIAERERELISIRTKAAWAVKKQQGTMPNTILNLAGTDENGEPLGTMAEVEAVRQKALAKGRWNTRVNAFQDNRARYETIKLLREDMGLSWTRIRDKLNTTNQLTPQGAEWDTARCSKFYRSYKKTEKDLRKQGLLEGLQ